MASPTGQASVDGGLDELGQLTRGGAGVELFDYKGQDSSYQAEACDLFCSCSDFCNCPWKFTRQTVNPVTRAASEGNVEELRQLIKSGVRVDEVDSEGWYPLDHAAANGQLECLELLLNHKDTVGVVWMSYGEVEKAMRLAAGGGHAECLEMIIEKDIDVITETKDGHNEDLIKGGAKLCLDEVSLTQVYIAALTEDQLETLEILLSVSARKFQPYHAENQTPLHLAILNNKIEAAKLILDYEIDVNTGYIYSWKPIATKYEMSPLYFAYSNGKMEMVRLFLARGAIPCCNFNACYLRIIIHQKYYLLNRYFDGFRELVNHGLEVSNCKYFPDHINYSVDSNFKLQFYKFLLDCGYKPNLNCWKKCLCNKAVSLSEILCICLAVSYVPVDICPTSLKYLKMSPYWPHIRKYIERPFSLQHLCRLAVREFLRPIGLHQMKNFASEMGITNVMKSYLLYEDYLTNFILKQGQHLILKDN